MTWKGGRVLRQNFENEVDELEWGFDLDHTGTSTQNIAAYIVPEFRTARPQPGPDRPPLGH